MIREPKNMDYETRKKTISDFEYQLKNEPEMNEFDSAFICGLLDEFKPKKIVEIGVAAGGTTSIILKKLENRDDDISMFSCDLFEEFYRHIKIKGEMVKTGFLANPIKLKTNVDHTFLLGDYFPNFADIIGGDIDFAIIDTVHSLPGELLDFLAILPHLSDNAVVVFHDISYHLWKYGRPTAFATDSIFNAIVADKIFKFSDEEMQGHSKIPNIAALQINKDTRRYVENIFGLFVLAWRYMPSDKELDIYRNYYQKYYDKILIRFYDEAIVSEKWLFEQQRILENSWKTKLKKNIKKIIPI